MSTLQAVWTATQATRARSSRHIVHSAGPHFFRAARQALSSLNLHTVRLNSFRCMSAGAQQHHSRSAPKPGLAAAAQAIPQRAADFSAWYHGVITAADLTDSHAPVRGTAILKPHGYAIWDNIKQALNSRIEETGHSNVYFPLLFPVSFLSKEAAHVDGFAKECAVVTHHRLRAAKGIDGKAIIEPDPEALLPEPLVIRPTSETVIWDAFSRWIHSYRDLPMLLNQWANVVRWEMRTRPFLRTSEFLWQEGHTAHATRREAEEEAMKMLHVYQDVCENVLAMPVTPGHKSPSERFAGAEDTLTCEAIMQNGWALQAATSHFLGQNFAKAFDVKFQDATGNIQSVWATSWGASTRLVGGLIMTHSDDTGLVLPPEVAPIQVAIVPIVNNKSPERHAEIVEKSRALVGTLKANGVRAILDDDITTSPGARFFKWERKGVPIRVEVGARDVDAGSAPFRWRTGGERKTASLVPATFVSTIQAELTAFQAHLLAAARARSAANTHAISRYSDLQAAAVHSDGGASAETAAPVFLVPWTDDAANEAQIKADTKYTIRCYPLENQGDVAGKTCFYSGRAATHMAIFARAF